MVYELKKIDLFGAIKISFFVNAVIGLLLGLFIGLVMAFFMGIFQQMIPSDQMNFNMPNFGALGFIGGIIVGFMYAIFIAVFNGIILTGIAVLLFNLFAAWLGGIKLTFNEIPAVIKSTMTLAEEKPDQGGSSNDV